MSLSTDSTEYDLKHIWIIDNWSKESKRFRLNSELFSPAENEGIQFYAQMYPNGDVRRSSEDSITNDNHQISVHLCSSALCPPGRVGFRISLIDTSNGKRFNSKEKIKTFTEQESSWGFNEFILHSALTSNDRDRIALSIEIQFLEDIATRQTEVISDSLVHTWRIANFAQLYQNEEWKDVRLVSDELCSSNFADSDSSDNSSDNSNDNSSDNSSDNQKEQSNRKHKLCLVLYPNGNDEARDRCLSIYLPALGPMSSAEWRISVLDKDGRSKETKSLFLTTSMKGISNFVPIRTVLDKLPDDYLPGGVLTFLCEAKIVSEPMKDYIFPILQPESATFTDAHLKVLGSCRHQWSIDELDIDAEVGECLEFDEFSCQHDNDDDDNQSTDFQVTLYPNGLNPSHTGYVGLKLFCRSDSYPLSVRYRLTMVDSEENQLFIRATLHKFTDQFKALTHTLSMANEDLCSLINLTLLAEVQIVERFDGGGNSDDNDSNHLIQNEQIQDLLSMVDQLKQQEEEVFGTGRQILIKSSECSSNRIRFSETDLTELKRLISSLTEQTNDKVKNSDKETNPLLLPNCVFNENELNGEMLAELKAIAEILLNNSNNSNNSTKIDLTNAQLNGVIITTDNSQIATGEFSLSVGKRNSEYHHHNQSVNIDAKSLDGLKAIIVAHQEELVRELVLITSAKPLALEMTDDNEETNGHIEHEECPLVMVQQPEPIVLEFCAEQRTDHGHKKGWLCCFN